MPELEPNWDNDNRSDHLASEAECIATMQDKKHRIVEVPQISMSFVISYKFFTILRTTFMGADQFQIEGGWVYDNPFSHQLDVNEITAIPTARYVK